jgi:hypothetical protein
MTGAICGVPLEVVKTEREPERWCFGCRRRLAGTWTCRRPSFETLMRTEAWGWAEPVWDYACDGCGEDRRAGFGMEYGWADDE